jgi:hypothetical protein
MRAILLTILFISIPVACVGMESIGESIDCTDVSVDFSDSPDLTREERLALMDKAFYESLNKFELCQAAKEMARSSVASSDNSGTSDGAESQTGGDSDGLQGNEGESNTIAGGTSSAGELSDLSGGIESVASSSMSGTEAKPVEPTDLEIPAADGAEQSNKVSGKEQSEQKGSSNGDGVNTDSGGIGTKTAKNGATPKDIPPSANDDALAAQIRYAAENETDPKKKAQLWNEYRKYKGLPQK